MMNEEDGLPQRLRIARTMRGLSQGELAEQVGVSLQAISKAERGATEPKVSTLKAICNVLQVDANWLLCVNPHDYIWDGMMFRTSVEALPAPTGKNYTPLGEQELPDV